MIAPCPRPPSALRRQGARSDHPPAWRRPPHLLQGDHRMRATLATMGIRRDSRAHGANLVTGLTGFARVGPHPAGQPSRISAWASHASGSVQRKGVRPPGRKKWRTSTPTQTEGMRRQEQGPTARAMLCVIIRRLASCRCCSGRRPRCSVEAQDDCDRGAEDALAQRCTWRWLLAAPHPRDGNAERNC